MIIQIEVDDAECALEVARSLRQVANGYVRGDHPGTGAMLIRVADQIIQQTETVTDPCVIA